jgi:hypothetical protein
MYADTIVIHAGVDRSDPLPLDSQHASACLYALEPSACRRASGLDTLWGTLPVFH